MRDARVQGMQFMNPYILILILYGYLNFGNAQEVNIFLSQNIFIKLKVKSWVSYDHIIKECTEWLLPSTR
jgi:hypothetical protein